MANRHVSLKDLARELQVSISTVSRALNNHPDISDEMRRKVKQLAEERNYTPNPLAMGLLKQSTRMIGIIVPDLVTHFYASILSGIEKKAKEEGYFIVIANSHESLENEKEAVQNLLKARVEGLIICLSSQSTDTGHIRQLLQRDIPIVLFDRVCLQPEVPAVTANNREAAEKITRHFFNQGYRNIAYISGPPHLNISAERLQGYHDGLQACGLPVQPHYLEHCDLTPQSAREAMQRLLALPTPPDAVFGINDTVAFALMQEIKARGLRIPHDLGVAGFTDEFHATVVEPALTTITHPTFEMGVQAAELFFQQLRSKTKPKPVCLQTELVVRASSKKES